MIATKTAIMGTAINTALMLLPASFLASMTPPEISLPSLFWGAVAGLCRGVATGLAIRKTSAAVLVGGLTAAGLHGAHIPGIDSLITGLSEANHDFIKGGFAVLFWGIGEDFLRSKWVKQ